MHPRARRALVTAITVAFSVASGPAALAQAPPAAPPIAPAPPPAFVPTPEQPYARGESPYRLRLDVDLPLSVLGVAVWATTYAVITPELAGPHCDPCDPSTVNGFDRWATHYYGNWAQWTANGIVIAAVPIGVLVKVLDYGPRNWKGWMTDIGVDLETVIWSGVLNEIFRRVVRRPRPYMYVPGAFPDERTSAEATLSFYSGHTAALFALAVSASYTYSIRHPRSPLRWAVWVGLLALASTEGVLRIFGGDHFPTDVIVGAVAGAGVGLLVPALHRKKRTLPEALRKVALVPSFGEGTAGLSLVGVF